MFRVRSKVRLRLALAFKWKAKAWNHVPGQETTDEKETGVKAVGSYVPSAG